MKLAREGVPFITAFVGLAILPAALAGGVLRAPAWAVLAASFPGLLLTLFSAWFFRDPDRAVPDGEGVVVAPADGKVVSVRNDPSGPSLAIFLNVFDVHVNRSPIAGRVESVRYTEGRFLAAFDERAGLENERNEIVITGAAGRVIVTQVAGLIARRIVCKVKPGDQLAGGQRLGLIRFGSRTDLRLPAGASVEVSVGDRVRGGASVVGRLPQGSAEIFSGPADQRESSRGLTQPAHGVSGKSGAAASRPADGGRSVASSVRPQ